MSAALHDLGEVLAAQGHLRRILRALDRLGRHQAAAYVSQAIDALGAPPEPACPEPARTDQGRTIEPGDGR